MKFTYRVTFEFGLYHKLIFDFESRSDALGFIEDAKEYLVPDPESDYPFKATIEPLIRDEGNN